jgi:hypothetical protein
MMSAENQNNPEQQSSGNKNRPGAQRRPESAAAGDKNKQNSGRATARRSGEDQSPAAGEKQDSGPGQRPAESQAAAEKSSAAGPPNSAKRGWFAENAVILALLGVALLVAVIGWQIEGRSGSNSQSSDPGRQGVDLQSTTGLRGSWYYTPEARFRPGAEAEVSESPGVITIQRQRTSGLITIENIDLDDSLPKIARQPGNRRIGSAVIYPAPDGQGRAVAFVGNKRWDLYFQGPESAQLLRQIITSAEPR